MLDAFERFASKRADKEYLAEIMNPLPGDIPVTKADYRRSRLGVGSVTNPASR
jgi:hypothetical protein